MRVELGPAGVKSKIAIGMPKVSGVAVLEFVHLSADFKRM
jgi:hypothetical protein